MTQGEISRDLRTARHTVRSYERLLARAQAEGMEQIVVARYEAACALLAAHRLLTGATTSVFRASPLSCSSEQEAERQLQPPVASAAGAD